MARPSSRGHVQFVHRQRICYDGGTPVTITGMTIKGAGKLINSTTGSFANSSRDLTPRT